MKLLGREFIVAPLAMLLAVPAAAQQIDNTATLPDAKPGECYAKVVVPPKMATRTEQLVVQAAAERIETTPAEFETVSEQLLVKDAGQRLEVKDATFSESTQQIEVRPAERRWVARYNDASRIPASAASLAAIADSGVNLDAAEVGTCFKEYYKPATYESQTQRVLVAEGYDRIVTQAAQYETVDERVVIKEASSRVVDVPAIFRNETESVLVEPARSEWKPGRGLVEKVDNSTGEIMCLVEIPARYETITKTVLDTPASTRTVEIPAEYKTVKVQRLVTPASESRVAVAPEYENVEVSVKTTDAEFFWLAKGQDSDANAEGTGQEVCLIERPAEFKSMSVKVLDEEARVVSSTIPARYQTVEMQKLVTPASERRVVIPERTRTITSQVQVEPARLEWRKVLCETNMTTEVIRSLQRALTREGYEPGPSDGVLGSGTLSAIEKYQLDKNIDRGGLTFETLEMLKVEL